MDWIADFLPPIAFVLPVALLVGWIENVTLQDRVAPLFECSIALNLIALFMRFS